MKTAAYQTPSNMHVSGKQHLTIRYSQWAIPEEGSVAIEHRKVPFKQVIFRLIVGSIMVVAFMLFSLLNTLASYFFQSSLLFLSGVVCWTFIEYVVHRFFMHAGKPSFGKNLLACGKYPNRTQRLIIFLLWIAVLITAVLWSPFVFIALGVVGGWLWYCYMRVFVQWKGMAKLLPALHRQHLYHLAGGHDKGFGWTTIWWDVWFRTAVPMGYVYSHGHGKKHAITPNLPTA